MRLKTLLMAISWNLFSAGQELQGNQHHHFESARASAGRGHGLHCLRQIDAVHRQVRSLS